VRLRVAPYRLAPRAAVGLGGSRDRSGMLLEVWPEGLKAPGYADCHPWPELGDPPLALHREALRRGQPTSLLERAFALGAADAEARSRGEGLFAGLTVPPSHALVSLSELPELPTLLGATGAASVKVKVGERPSEEARALARAHQAHPALRWRLDANGRFAADDFRGFWRSLPPTLRPLVDFIEDPTPFDATLWAALSAELGCVFAWDRGSSAWAPGCPGVGVLVSKPAWDDSLALARRVAGTGVGLVITTALGHPLGSLAAAWVAARAATVPSLEVLSCGLLSHAAYRPDAFSEALRVDEGVLRPLPGAGLGLGSLLEALAWEQP